jgi:sarcosine oxidase subunit gamma
MNTTPTPIGGFAGLKASHAKGVSLRERDGLGLAMVLARRGQRAALSSRLKESFGDVSFMATGPDTWLAVRAEGGNAFASALREAMGDLASIVDQSDGLAVVRVSGPMVRDVLCKLFAIDLDARVFKPGDVAVTPAGHIGATLWRLEDEPDGSATFEIAVHRSFAASFWEHLVEAAA